MLSGVRSSKGRFHAVETSHTRRHHYGPNRSFHSHSLGTRYWLLLPHLSPHPQQLPHRPRRQPLHLIMQLRHRLKKPGHSRQPFPRKIRPCFLRIQLFQTPPQHLPRRINLPPLPLLNHQPEHLPNILHRLIMLPPVAQHMHRPHNPPTLQLPDRRAHIRPRHAQSLRNLLRRQRPRRQIQQCMNLRDGAVNPPPRPHLSPMQNVLLLHTSQSRHIIFFSSNRIYRTNHRQVNPDTLSDLVIPNEVRNPLPAGAASIPKPRRNARTTVGERRFSAASSPRRMRASAPVVAIDGKPSTATSYWVLGTSSPRLPTLLNHLLLSRHLPSRLRPLPLLIPPIMKRLVRRLFLHPSSLTHPPKHIQRRKNAGTVSRSELSS